MSDNFRKLLAPAVIIFFPVITLGIGTPSQKVEVYVETYRVKKDDTLWDISQHYHRLDERNLPIFDYLDEVKNLNPCLKDREYILQPDDVITFQYKKIVP